MQESRLLNLNEMNLLFNLSELNLLISGELWFDFLSRFVANFISLFILIRYIFYPNNGQSKYLFIFYMTGLMIFLISSTLDQVTLNIGIALGLFAIFGIIRFRTPPVGLKEMTYLFISIGMAVINALVEFNVANWFGLTIANFIILSSAFFMEKYTPRQTIIRKVLVFSPSSFAILNSNKLLKKEIEEITGIKIIKVDISKMNKVKNEISVYISFKMVEKLPTGLLNDEETEKNQELPKNSYWGSSFSSDY